MNLKILHYTGVYAPAWKWGGPPRSSANLAEGAIALGHSVTVFTTNAGLENDPEIPTDRPVLRNGVKVHYFPARTNFLGLQSEPLEAAVRERVREFDVVHITGVWQPTSVAACRVCELAGIPYIVSPRGALSPYSFTQKPWKKWPFWWLRERRNCDRATAIHYTSVMEKRECVGLRLMAKAFVVPNAIDLSAWTHDADAGQAWRASLGRQEVSTEAKILLYAGRQHHKKGLDLLPGALSGLTGVNWHLVLLGDDEDGSGSALAAAMAERSLGGRVTFLPATGSSGLRAAYSGANLFLLPSRHENFGNVAIEALACGCPVLLSDGVGVADQVLDLAGVEVAARDAVLWGKALGKALASPIPPRRDEIIARFSIEVVAGAMCAIYEELHLNA